MTYTEEEIINEVERISKEYCANESPILKDMRKYSKVSVSNIYNVFDSWNQALKKSGFSINRRGRRISDQELINAIKRVEKRIDDDVPTVRDFRKYSEYSDKVCRDKFGSWNNSLKKAGYKPNEEKNISEEDVVRSIRLCYNKSNSKNKKLSQTVYKNFDGEFCHQIYRNHFENWQEACNNSGLKPLRYSNIPNQEVLIKRLKKANKKYDRQIHIDDIKNINNLEKQWIIRSFGTFTNALVKAKIKKKWSEEEIINEIKKLTSNRKTITVTEFLEKSDCPLSKIYKKFGNWTDALEEADVKSRGLGGSYFEEEIIEEIQKVSEEHLQGSRPRQADLWLYGDISGVSVRKKFDGGWKEALERAGFSTDKLVGQGGTGGCQVYGEDWEEMRKKTRDRDKCKCRVCGNTKNDTRKRPAVHHIKPRKKFIEQDNLENMNNISNLISLCRYCHSALEGKWQDASPEEFAKRGREYLDIEIEDDEQERTLLDY